MSDSNPHQDFVSGYLNMWCCMLDAALRLGIDNIWQLLLGNAEYIRQLLLNWCIMYEEFHGFKPNWCYDLDSLSGEELIMFILGAICPDYEG